MSGTILVATASQGVIRSADDGKTWHRTALKQAIEFDAVVRSLDCARDNPTTVYAGADAGLVVSHDGGSHWQRVESPFTGETVWKVAVDPNDSQRIFVGTGAPSRAVLWRTLDAGASWYRVPVELPEHCPGVSKPRLLAFAYDPKHRNRVWFGVEEGGLFRSDDGGDTFERIDDRLLWQFKSDVHGISVLPDADGTVIVVCVNAIYTSRDGGETFSGTLPKKQFDLYYARALAASTADPGTVYVSVSDGTPGTTSMLLVSRDGATTWEPIALPQPESCIWAIRCNPVREQQMVLGSKYGTLFTSNDGGQSWCRQWRSFPEISDVLWIPETADIQPAHKSDIA
jgi:photosystem II stability/assembly factor-like uncharacterized protein